MNRSRLMSAALIVLAALVFCVTCVFIAVKGDFEDFSKAILAFFGSNKDGDVTVVPGDDGKIYDALRGVGEDPNITVDSGLSFTEVEKILSNVEESNSYHCVFKVTRLTGGIFNETHEVRKSGEKFRINTQGADGDRFVISDGERCCFGNSDGKVKIVDAGEFSVYDEASIASPKQILSLISRDGSEAECMVIRNTAEGYNILYVSYTMEGGYEEIAYIHINAGIVIKLQSYYNGELTYEYSTDFIRYDVPISDSLFEF